MFLYQQKIYAAVKAHFKAMKPGTGFGGKSEVGIKIGDLLSRIKVSQLFSKG